MRPFLYINISYANKIIGMKKIYNKKLIQYSLQGEIIQIFLNVKEAIKIVNYDSIIKCCIGKYKTAGGYVWRFEGDDFEVKLDIKKEYKCNICNSLETVRSMAMHLRHVHKLKTNEYVKKYGEFRPKILKNNTALEKSNFQCFECNIKLKSNQHLMYHITKKHPEITQIDYIIKHIENGEAPLCKCGCGEKVVILRNGKNCDLKKEIYHRDYIKGHWDWEVFSGIGKQSKEEINLFNYIKSVYNGEIQTNVRGLIPKYEIDIFLPELSIGIEYNGLYWHSEKSGKHKNYHFKKFESALNNNIRLIQIFSDEWLNKKEIVESKLKSILKINNKNDFIFARKCEIKEINSKLKDEFLTKYHIQGKDKSSIKIGLFIANNLVGLATFSKPRIALGGITHENKLELSRYASSSYIIGGLPKIIKYLKSKYNPHQIYSYSDNRWTDPNNNMYLKNNFIKQKQSNPGYFYTKNFLVRLHRYNFNKFKLKEMGADTKNKTEFQIMEELGYTKIWDCGATKFVLYV